MKTVLCVPGHDEAKVKKCRQYGADLILFDLEDSVPEGM
jgi:citrate lyase beta subunit